MCLFDFNLLLKFAVSSKFPGESEAHLSNLVNACTVFIRAMYIFIQVTLFLFLFVFKRDSLIVQWITPKKPCGTWANSIPRQQLSELLT